jgi:hypothetical protein
MYSVAAGEKATDDSACAEGGPLVIQHGYFQCPEGDKTVAELPQVCLTDSDCIGTSGVSTKCVSGLDTAGKAYCELHAADPAMLSLKLAERDHNYEAETYWRFYTGNYPYLQGDIAACTVSAWDDLTASRAVDLTENSSEFLIAVCVVGGLLCQFLTAIFLGWLLG